MTLKTLKDLASGYSGYPGIANGARVGWSYLPLELREAAKAWRDKLKETLEKACEMQEDNFYNNSELEIEGVIYEASAFEDDEAKPIIKFINQFFNLEDEDE